MLLKPLLRAAVLTGALAVAPSISAQVSYTDIGLTIGPNRPVGSDGQIVISGTKGVEWYNGLTTARFNVRLFSSPCIGTNQGTVHFLSPTGSYIDIQCLSVYMKDTDALYKPASDGTALDMLTSVRTNA